MQNLFKNVIGWLIFGIVASFIMIISRIIFTKARTTTNPTTTDDGQWLYTTAGTTLTAAKWNNLVNRSSFRAYLNNTQSVATTTWTKVNIDTKEFDTNSEFDTSSGKFTPKRAGRYFLTAQCSVSSISDGKGWQVAVYKNWSLDSRWTQSPNGSATSNISSTSVIVEANWTSDYFEVYCWHNQSTSSSLGTGRSSTYFAGFRVE